jgi:hypothetical protein
MLFVKLACKPIFQKINTLYEKASIEVEGKHFDLDILMGGDMKFLQLVLGLGGSLCNYSCPWYWVHKNHKRADDMFCYTHIMSLNNVLKKKQLYFQLLFLTIKLNYLHDLKIMFQCLLHLITYFIEITPNLHV